MVRARRCAPSSSLSSLGGGGAVTTPALSSFFSTCRRGQDSAEEAGQGGIECPLSPLQQAQLGQACGRSIDSSRRGRHPAGSRHRQAQQAQQAGKQENSGRARLRGGEVVGGSQGLKPHDPVHRHAPHKHDHAGEHAHLQLLHKEGAVLRQRRRQGAGTAGAAGAAGGSKRVSAVALAAAAACAAHGRAGQLPEPLSEADTGNAPVAVHPHPPGRRA